MTPELIREQAKDVRGAELDSRRAQELAADTKRAFDAIDATRSNLQFNDEPARFAALLDHYASPSRRTR